MRSYVIDHWNHAEEETMHLHSKKRKWAVELITRTLRQNATARHLSSGLTHNSVSVGVRNPVSPLQKSATPRYVEDADVAAQRLTETPPWVSSNSHGHVRPAARPRQACAVP